VPPRNYSEIIDGGYQRGRDFRVVTGNHEQVGPCLLVAPHGGSIEPMTSEIVTAVASVSNRAYYLFEGKLRRDNWNALHIDSTSFDEPEFERLVAETELVISFHGAERDRGRNVYVGGLHERGRGLMVEGLNVALRRFDVTAVDAARAKAARSIAGLHPGNLTNRGRRGAGVQLEFSDGARLVFFRGRSRAERQHPNEHLILLAQAIDAVLRQLTNLPPSEALSSIDPHARRYANRTDR
jgi:phage replication-related protein YjqB (UPF0714/DUF867 family)